MTTVQELSERLGLQATFGVYGAVQIIALAAFFLPAARAKDMAWPQEL